MTLPNGQNVYPQDNIPPMEVVSVERAYGTRYETDKDETDSILDNIAIVVPESAQTDHIDEVSGSYGGGAARHVG